MHFEAPTDANTDNVYQVVVTVTDNGTPPLSDSQTVNVTVTNANDAPVLSDVPATASIPEVVLYTFDAGATDVDVPAQTLTFSLVDAPTGAAIDPATGVFTWTPTEAQGPGSYPFTVRVSDGTANTDASITLTVTDVNVAPILTDVPAIATIPEMVAYTFDAGATDVDLPAQTLTFSLVDAPTGAAIDPATGVFTWTPTEAQGPGSYPFTVRVYDGVVNTDAAITLTVTEANLAPTDISLSNATVKENRGIGAAVGSLSATDPDLPAQTFTYSLVNGAGSSGNAYFTIVGNALKTAVSFNYEAGDTYSIRQGHRLRKPGAKLREGPHHHHRERQRALHRDRLLPAHLHGRHRRHHPG